MFGRALHHALYGVRILARSESDAWRYRDLGADPTRTQVIGNLKLGRVTSEEHKPRLIERHYVIAASTHHDEEIQLAKAWKQHPGTALLVIAPRHPERGPDIQKQLRAHGIDCALRSADEQIQPDQNVYIADTVGEMMDWYTHAAGAYVGGSLIPRGGQNMLEPAQLECPCVVGKHTENFADIMSSLLQNDAITVAEQATEVAGFLDKAAKGDRQTAQMARRAKQVATENSAVLQRYMTELQHSN